MNHGLSDALSQLAKGEPGGQSGGGGESGGGPPQTLHQSSAGLDDDVIIADLDDDDTTTDIPFQPHTTPSARTTRPTRKRKHPDRNQGLKAIAVPILATVGLLMFIPAVWAIMLLSGQIQDARTDATAMAYLGLASGAIGMVLFAAAAFYFLQLQKQKKRQKP